MNLLRFLVFSLLILSLISCAERKPITTRDFHASNLTEYTKKLNLYSTVESVLFIEYEGKGKKFKGDALLRISDSKVLLRVYYMGFPAGEITEEGGEINSTVAIEKDRARELIRGLRKAFLWWKGDFTLFENEEEYVLRENDRILLLRKENFIPTTQILTVEGHEITIIYENPQKVQAEDGTLVELPMTINLFYRDRSLVAKIEKIKLKNE